MAPIFCAKTGRSRDGIEKFYKRGLHLEYFTVGYNILEAAASIVFGGLAGSIALVGFGMDSIVESLSGLVLIWRLGKHAKLSAAQEELVEKRAMRFVAATFFILGAYVLYESLRKLILTERPEHSLPGIIIAVASIIVMPILAWRKRTTGEAIGSRALVADSKETLVCAVLSLALLIGLGANYLFGFWLADPIVGLLIVIFLAKEGWEGWREAGEEEGEEEGRSGEISGGMLK